jgi:hypothetical protein
MHISTINSVQSGGGGYKDELKIHTLTKNKLCTMIHLPIEYCDKKLRFFINQIQGDFIENITVIQYFPCSEIIRGKYNHVLALK